MTLNQIRRQMAEIIVSSGIDDALTTARFLIQDTLCLTQTQMLLHDSDNIDQPTADLLLGMARKAASGTPLQYITHKAYFGGMTLYADYGALIPRPETEQLADTAAELAQGTSLLDIGTGTGCIALSIKQRRPELNVTAIDISDDALRIARTNARQLSLDISTLQADILQPHIGIGPFDTIVSNPPYICQSEMADMKSNVLEHEPHNALFVPDNDPLLFYRAICRHCTNGLLRKGGLLLFEINEAYPEQTIEMMKSYGFSNARAENDIYGKPRICIGTLLR